MHKLAALLFAVLTLNVYAFQGRPVSDVRFDGAASVGYSKVATDGTNFLVLSTHATGFGPIFAQKIGANGQPAAPQHLIARGSILARPAALCWTGNHYLAAWRDASFLRVAAVSREGTLLSAPVTVLATEIVADARGALAFRHHADKLSVQRLDFDGNPIGAAAEYAMPSPSSAIHAGSAAGGFGVVVFGSMMTFRPDGTPITPAPVSLGIVPWTAAIATNGNETMVLSAFKDGSNAGLRTTILHANGTVKSAQTARTRAATFLIDPFGLLWDGAQYIAGATVSPTSALRDPALLRIASDGIATGDFVWLSQDPRAEIAAAMASNGREIFVPIYDTFISSIVYPRSFAVAVDAATLTPRAPARLGRTVATQEGLSLEAVPGGYLAAWFENAATETTVRVSRIDRAGNYLDGEGIVLASGPAAPRDSMQKTAIDVSGPRWLVTWTSAVFPSMYGARFVTHHARPDGAILPYDYDAAVQWKGDHYVELGVDGDASLVRRRRSATWELLETERLAESEVTSTFPIHQETYYSDPFLVTLGEHLLAVYVRHDTACGFMPGDCDDAMTVTGLLDAPGATPFTIAETHDDSRRVGVAASATQALVTWYAVPSLRGVFLPAAAPEQVGAPFVVRNSAEVPRTAVASDGNDFYAAWTSSRLLTARISPSGVVSDLRGRPSGDSFDSDPVIAASATQAPLAGFTGRFTSFDAVPRAMLVFPGELKATEATVAPEVLCATRIDDATLRVSWSPVESSLGVAIELQLPDGNFRMVGVASAGATSATIPLPDLEGTNIRVRAWNAFGVSAASGIAPSLPAPSAVVRANPFACAGVPVEVTASLQGTAPFVVQWSDGFTQSVNASTAKRFVTLDAPVTLSVLSVSDASCEVGTLNGGVDIHVGAAPRITQQTTTLRVKPQQTATLNVTTSAPGAQYAWYEGVRGDTTHPVGRNTATFTTPPMTRATQYWARLTTSCGTIDSQTMTVAVDGKRRAAGK